MYILTAMGIDGSDNIAERNFVYARNVETKMTSTPHCLYSRDLTQSGEGKLGSCVGVKEIVRLIPDPRADVQRIITVSGYKPEVRLPL